ncbi:MAG TPA: hypothetical protein VJ944_02930 [Thermoplasmataceae archaeon]|nr:hypothetical protein [Thermoplasmataceae archaeon]
MSKDLESGTGNNRSENVLPPYDLEIESSLTGRVNLLRNALKFKTVSGSPCIVYGHDHPILYIPADTVREDLPGYIGTVSKSLYFLAINGGKISCPKCLTILSSQFSSAQSGSRTVKDYVGDPELLQRTRHRYSSSHNRWRRNLLKSSGNSCSVCSDSENLELAHITSVEDFFYRYKKGRWLRYPNAKYLGVEYSYREDNLSILCRRCHDAQTASWDLLCALDEPDKFLEVIHRKHKVTDLFENIMERRGWRSAEDLFQSRLF